MPVERFFSSQPFSIGQLVSIEEEEFHHLIHVVRCRSKDEIELVNGQGQLATAILQGIEKKNALAQIKTVFNEEPKKNDLVLAQAIPRLNRLEFILEKGTELGMSEVWLFASERSERRDFSENQKRRLQHIVISAMKQCGRLYLPFIKFISPIEEWPPLPQIAQTAFFGDLNPHAPPLISAWKARETNLNSAVVCIGPESGFSDRETKKLIALGMTGVKLHSNILRTDTAAIMALSILSHLYTS